MAWLPHVAIVYPDKTAGPAVTDDQNAGHQEGDLWIDETNDKAYILVDVTAGAAVWLDISSAAAADVTVDVTNFGGILSAADTTVQAALDTIDDHLHDGRYYTETEVDTLLAAQDALSELTDVTITLASAGDYLRYSGAAWVDVAVSQLESDINHDNLTGFVGNEHIDHTAVTLTAGTGLTGGGDISANRSFALSHLGIESLADPGADRILFWDDIGAGAVTWLSLGTNLSISGTVLSVDAHSSDHDDRFYTETELDAGQLDNRYYTETEVDILLGAQDALAEMADVTITAAAEGDYLRRGAVDWNDVTVSQILTDLLTVDGAGSGLDADTLDGQEGAYYEADSHLHDGETLQADGINSNGGAFSFSTSGSLSIQPVTSLLVNDAGNDVDFRVEAVGFPTAFQVTGSDGTVDMAAGTLRIGVNDTTSGLLYLFGSGGNAGGKAYWYLGANFDATIQYYSIQINADDLLIGPDTDLDALKLDSNKNLYITDGALYVSDPTAGYSELQVGLNDTNRGLIYIMGNGAGSVLGGRLLIYMAADHDASLDYYMLQSYEDDFQLGPNTDLDALKLDSNKDLYITDGDFYVQNAGTTTLWMNASSAQFLLGTSDATQGSILLWSNGAGQAEGGLVVFTVAPDYDTTIADFRIQANQDDLLLGPVTNTDMLKLDGGSGLVGFGTHTAIGAETVTGYITIQDEAGNSRKIAVVS